ncbi:MAG: GC-type dockerin domain-anchored protein, partial [Phycisphaerales bacterium]
AFAQCPLSNCSAGLYQTPTCSLLTTWQALPVVVTSGSGSASLSIQGTGGNPGCYDRLTTFYSPPLTGGTIHAPWLLQNAIVNSPIAAINYYEDNIHFGGGPFSTCLIQQSGSLYIANARRVPTASSWTSRCILNLIPSDFIRISGTGPSLPSFSGSPPMNLGFARTFSVSANATLTSGIDNVRFQLVGLPPSNDACFNARTFDVGQSIDGDSNCCATTDSSSTCGGTRDVWYKFTPTCGGPVTINTCGSSFDTILTIYDDCPGGGVGNQIACNDDATAGLCNGTTQSEVTFTPNPCTTYYVRVAGFSDSDCGPIVLRSSQLTLQPLNDDCSAARTIPTGTTPFSTCGATTDGIGQCVAPNDVWFRYVATCNGYVTATIPVNGVSFNPVISILCDTCIEPYELSCNSDNCAPGPFPCASTSCGSRFVAGAHSRVKVRAGQSLLIRVGGVAGQTGVGQIIMACTPSVPDNDQCTNAPPLRPGDFLYGSTIGATASGGTAFCSATSPDVWYEFIPPTTGNYTFDTCTPPICFGAGQPMYNTVLSVHTDCANTIPAIACNDNSCGQQSRVTVALNACQKYLVRVAGVGSQTGDFTLQASSAPAAAPPSNDNISGATLVTVGTNTVRTGGATTSTTTPAPPFQLFNDVWYRYCVNCPGQVTVTTCNSPAGLDTGIAVYSGPSASPTLIASNNDALIGNCSGSTLSATTFNATSGQCYWIRVGSTVPGQSMCARLNIVGPNPPTGTCPSGTLSGIRYFQVMGPSNNTPWSWCLSAPCCFSVSGNSAGEPILTPVAASRNALAARFAASINASCGNGTNLRAVHHAPSASNTFGPGVFSIKTKCNPPFSFPFFTLSVGSSGTPCSLQCVVAEVGGTGVVDPIPTSGPCSFNPPIMELPVSGLDCNANEIDDLVDIVLGNDTDVNGNGVPDSCESLCLGDFNNDGGVDGDDVIAFFNAWDAGTITADVNQDGAVDGDDVITFFNAWDSGC